MGLTRIRAEQISDIDYKQAVRVVTTAPVTLSGGAPSQVDTVNLNAGDRILVTAQGTASQNGLYDVESVGTGSDGTWVRTADANATGEISAGMVVMVTEGVNYADTMWKLITDNPITVGSTGLTFVPNPSTSFTTIQANGTAVIANAASSTLTLTPGNNVTITGNNASDTVIIGLTDTASFTGNITGGNLNINGDVSITGNLTIGANLNVVNVNEFVGATGNISFLGNLLPAGNVGNLPYALGLPDYPWGNVYATNFSTVAGNFSTGNLYATGTVSAVGNIQGQYVLGNGAFLTGLPAGYANSNAASYFASGTSSSNISITGNLLTTSYVSATGNITGGNIITSGQASIGGFTIGANTITSQGPTLTIDPNASGGVDGEVVIAGNLQVQGNVTYINSNVVSINDLVFNTANNAATASQANGGGLGVGPVDAEYATWLYNSTANIWVSNIGISAVGNISAGNLSGTLTTPSQPNITSVGTLTSLSVTGNLTANNISILGSITAPANVYTPAIQNGGTGITLDAGYPGYITFFNGTGQKAKIDDGGNLSVVGNVYSGNISTAGNISGNYIFGNGSLLTGIITSVANINNGTSNISVYENGNIAVSVSNVANTVVFDPVATLSTVDFSTTGNIYGNVLNGNGAGITGIQSIGNVGNCSVQANLADGNVSISADGQANLATFNLGTMTMLGAYANPNTIDISVSVIGNVNGMMVGPIAFGPSGNIQIPDSSRIVIL